METYIKTLNADKFWDNYISLTKQGMVLCSFSIAKKTKQVPIFYGNFRKLKINKK